MSDYSPKGQQRFEVAEKRTADYKLNEEREAVHRFLYGYFGEEFVAGDLTPQEQETIDEIVAYTNAHVVAAASGRRRRYVLGLALDFLLLAQQVCSVDPGRKRFSPTLTEGDLRTRYRFVKERGGDAANTLTLERGAFSAGIRPLEEAVLALFHRLKRPEYPVAYVYNTGQWHKYIDLLVLCFRLSESGRYVACLRLITYGLANMEKNETYGRLSVRVRLFPKIVDEYVRGVPGEKGGLVFQAIAYGYFKADRPHLSLVTDKTRGSSRRQYRIADVDGYKGLDLEFSAEVKDLVVTSDNVNEAFGDFIDLVAGYDAAAIAFVKEGSDEARSFLEESGVEVITQQRLLEIVGTWDWPKQDAAVQGVLHFLAHVEQSPPAYQRLLQFVKRHNPTYDALVYLKPPEEKEAQSGTQRGLDLE